MSMIAANEKPVKFVDRPTSGGKKLPKGNPEVIWNPAEEAR